MQAILLFVMFGVIASVMGGIVGLNSSSVPLMLAQQKQAQEESFRTISTVVLGHTLPEFMQSPGSSNTVNIGTYLCGRQELRQLITCDASNRALDFWGRRVLGYLRRNNTVSFSSQSLNGVYSLQAPVTAYLMVSPGPDGRVDARLTADLADLSSTSTMREVLRVAAYREGTGDASKDSLDDVVYSFSDQRAQERNWKTMQSSLNRIALAAMRNYQTQFNRYSDKLAGNYTDEFKTGPVIINDNLLDKWQGTGGSSPDFGNVSNTYALGVDQEQEFIERNPGTGSSMFALNINTPTNNTLDVYVTANSGSPWKLNGGRTCGSSVPVNCMRIKVGT